MVPPLALVVSIWIALLMLPSYCNASSVLATLQPQHPRLFLHNADLPAIKHAISTDPFVGREYHRLLAYGDELLTMQPDTYGLQGSEHSLLATARDMEGRIFTLAGLYRLTGDQRFAARATQEMLAAAAFPNWNPKHFLDTAEMTAALGLGYDWLYSTISPADRATIRKAIATKGIDPWLKRLQGKGIPRNNWTQVCNGGETIGALAIAHEDPARASKVLDSARSAIADIMTLFAPDGGFEEGPMYWKYATIYNALYIDALDSALGRDFGAAAATGFSSTGDYRIQSDGPTHLVANFGDSNANGAAPVAQMFWFARRFNKPVYAEHEIHLAQGRHLEKGHDRFGLFMLLWAAEWSAQAPSSGRDVTLPLVQSFVRIGQAYMRSAWHDPNAWYVGFKCGHALASHGDLDLGSFVMDAFGQRWASELGADSYGLPGYFNFHRQRWTYYRTRTEGQNTLTIDGQNEDLDAVAPISAAGTMGNTLYAIGNLDQAYKGKLRSWKRGVALIHKQRVLVEDEIVPAQSVDVVWNFHTFARVEIAAGGRSAMLTEGGVTLRARILAPSSARFSTVSTKVPPPQRPNPGLTNLVISLKKQSRPETIAILFARPEDNATPRLRPLSTWK
ncbi:MAG: heparinase II/III domain-containing protein [Bryobacteraceae bacterium]